MICEEGTHVVGYQHEPYEGAYEALSGSDTPLGEYDDRFDFCPCCGIALEAIHQERDERIEAARKERVEKAARACGGTITTAFVQSCDEIMKRQIEVVFAHSPMLEMLWPTGKR